MIRYQFGPDQYLPGLPWEGDILRISEDIRQCVVFLGPQKAGPMDTAPINPKGTGFLVYGGSVSPGDVFLVTAKHVAEKLDPPFVIRFNKKGGGAKLVHIDRPADIKWCYHPDPTVDIAVAPIFIPSWANARFLKIDNLLQDLAEMEGVGVGAGDLACVIGLFHLLYGQRENLPITHVGHIAMLPGDELIPVEEKNGKTVHREGYLLQANAISGCSGSPVFFVQQAAIDVNENTLVGYHVRPFMLGVWSSSWKVKGSDVVAARTDDDDMVSGLAPLGMGVVTPLKKLIDVLTGDDLKQAASSLRKMAQSENAATSDFLDDAHPASDENPTHREDFTSLLNAAAKTPPQGD